jgi:hypothetical protein
MSAIPQGKPLFYEKVIDLILTRQAWFEEAASS